MEAKKYDNIKQPLVLALLTRVQSMEEKLQVSERENIMLQVRPDLDKKQSRVMQWVEKATGVTLRLHQTLKRLRASHLHFLTLYQKTIFKW